MSGITLRSFSASTAQSLQLIVVLQITRRLDCIERTGFMLTESSSFPRMTILSVWIYEYHALLLSAAKPAECTLHGNLTMLNRISETKVSLTDWAFHNHLQRFR